MLPIMNELEWKHSHNITTDSLPGFIAQHRNLWKLFMCGMAVCMRKWQHTYADQPHMRASCPKALTAKLSQVKGTWHNKKHQILLCYLESKQLITNQMACVYF